MNIANYIERARLKLADTVQPYRFIDSDITTSLGEALKRARQVRPSLAYNAGRLVALSDDVNFAATPTTVVRASLDTYAEALVLLAAARVLANDNSDTNNPAVAERWRSQGLELLTI